MTFSYFSGYVSPGTYLSEKVLRPESLPDHGGWA